MKLSKTDGLRPKKPHLAAAHLLTLTCSLCLCYCNHDTVALFSGWWEIVCSIVTFADEPFLILGTGGYSRFCSVFCIISSATPHAACSSLAKILP